MTMSLEAAAQAMREAMRETVKRHSLWYLVEGGLMILAGILALVYPVASSFAALFLLGCVLIASGIVQGISLIDAREVPHFWLQLVSVVLSIIVGVLLIRHRGAGLWRRLLLVGMCRTKSWLKRSTNTILVGARYPNSIPSGRSAIWLGAR